LPKLIKKAVDQLLILVINMNIFKAKGSP